MPTSLMAKATIGEQFRGNGALLIEGVDRLGRDGSVMLSGSSVATTPGERSVARTVYGFTSRRRQATPAFAAVVDALRYRC